MLLALAKLSESRFEKWRVIQLLDGMSTFLSLHCPGTVKLPLTALRGTPMWLTRQEPDAKTMHPAAINLPAQTFYPTVPNSAPLLKK